MTKRNKVILAVSLGIVAIAGTFGGIELFKYLKKKKEEKKGEYKKPDVVEEKKPTSSQNIPMSNVKFPIKKGDYNNEAVGVLQTYLNNSSTCKKKFANARLSFSYPLTVDNDFGSNTEGALEACYGIKEIDRKLFNEIAKKVSP